MKKIVTYIILSAILFSTMEVTLKIAGNQLDAFQLTFIRFFVGGIFLLPFALIEIKKRGTAINRRDYLYMLLLGFICICVSMLFFQFGVENSNASTSAVIFCINPMFTMIFAHFLTDEKLNRTKLFALTVGILGIIFMINPLNMGAGNTFIGISFTIIAAATFGLYSAMGKKTIRKLGGLTTTSISFILGSLVMLPFLWLTDRPIISGITPDNIMILLYISIMVTGLGYLFYFLAMQESDAATASIVFFLKPGIAPVIAVIALHETIGINGFIGIALIFAGSFINLREQKASKSKHKIKQSNRPQI